MGILLLSACVSVPKKSDNPLPNILGWRTLALRLIDKELHTLPCFDSIKYTVEQTKDYQFVKQIPIDKEWAALKSVLNNTPETTEVLIVNSIIRFGYNQEPSPYCGIYIYYPNYLKYYAWDTTIQILREDKNKEDNQLSYESTKRNLEDSYRSFCEDACVISTVLNKKGEILRIKTLVGYLK